MTSNITFYFVRHGYSCHNLTTEKMGVDFRRFFRGKHTDPHLSNWGILASILSGINLEKKITKISDIFVSPLLRTWETALCMFGNFTKNIKVAPYLREESHFGIYSYASSPRDFAENQLLFSNFKLHLVENDTTFTDIISNNAKIKNKIKQIINSRIVLSKNLNLNNYESPGDLTKFVKWCVANNKKSRNILAVAHGKLLGNYYKSLTGENYVNNNNKIIKSVYNYSLTKGLTLKSIDIFYEGTMGPTKEELKKIKTVCSLCSSCVGDNKSKKRIVDYTICKSGSKIRKDNKEVHKKLLD